MELRTLGNSEINIVPLAFGGNVFGWTVDEPTSFQLLDAFADAGFNFVDTADVYTTWVAGNKGGESEIVIGKWMRDRGNRDKMIIATKVGSDMGNGNKGLSAKYIRKAVEESLSRLQTDYIDLYQSHRDDLSTPVEETLEAYAALMKEGKIRAIGASNFTRDRLAASLEASMQHGYPSYVTLQPEYNLYTREEFERNLEPFCREHHISVLPYYSLASGFLTGKYRSEDDLSKSQRGNGVRKYLNDRGFKILEVLDEVAEEYNTKPATIALAWLMTKPTVTAPVTSATNIQQLEILTNALHIALHPASIAQLDAASEY